MSKSTKKKNIKVRDLNPKKDAKGGFARQGAAPTGAAVTGSPVTGSPMQGAAVTNTGRANN
jgi:hypothetical protein